MANALNYMFQDKSFYVKASIIFIITAISFVLGIMQNTIGIILSSIIGGILGMVILGYFYSCVHAVKNSDFDISLPNVDPFSALFTGFKATVGIFILSLAFGILSVFLFYIPIIILLFIYPAIVNVFASDYNLSSFFAFNKAFAVIKSDFGKYFVTLFQLVVFFTISGLIMFFIFGILGIAKGVGALNNIPTQSAIILSLVFASIYTYSIYVVAYLIGDIYKLDQYDIEEKE